METLLQVTAAVAAGADRSQGREEATLTGDGPAASKLHEAKALLHPRGCGLGVQRASVDGCWVQPQPPVSVR